MDNRKKIITLFILALLIIALPLSVIIVRQQTQTRSEAEQTTTLYFSPDTSQTPLELTPQKEFSLDVMINPGENLVTLVKIGIEYDPSKFMLARREASFETNRTIFRNIVEGPKIVDGKLYITVSIGNDPSRAISSVTKVGTLYLKTQGQTNDTPAEISFTGDTEVFSASSTDQASENVLSGTSNAVVSIKAPQIANCTLAPNTKPGTVYETELNGQLATPPTDSGALGRARVVIPPQGDILNLTYVSFCYNGLSGINSGVSIHYPARSGERTQSRKTLPVSGFPNGNITNFPIRVSNEDKRFLENGQWYIEVRSIEYRDGEIRGQFNTQPSNNTITPSPTIPVSPTLTPDPPATQPTLPPEDVSLNVTIKLHGIGSSGDNRNPNDSSQSNKNPQKSEREVVVEIFDAQERKVAETEGTVTYEATSGAFEGTMSIPSTVPNGSYLVKLKMDGYLRANVPGIQTFQNGQTTTLPEVAMTAGDVNKDNALDIRDYNIILGCYSDLLPARSCNESRKSDADIQSDGEVNQIDYNLFIREITFQRGA